MAFKPTISRTRTLFEALEPRRFFSAMPLTLDAPVIPPLPHLIATIAADRSPTIAGAADVARPAVTWKAAAPSPIDRFESAGAVVAGKLYVFGGFYNAQINVTSRSDVYDPRRNQWRQIADMPEPL